MSENKFLKNLNQSAGQLPATTPPGPTAPPARRSNPSGSGGDESDPIQRLTNEMSRHSRGFESLSVQISQQPPAVTQSELETLLAEAKAGVRYTPNSERIAQTLLPYLLNGLPTPDQLKAAADAGASAITAAGEAAARRIEQATAMGATRIEGACKSKADEYAGLIGFTSWKSAVTVVLMIVLMVVLANYQSERQAERIAQAQQETQAVREFTNWVKGQPEGKQLYDQYYNR